MKVKEYSNGEVTIVWKPELCIHSANCVKGLPEVIQKDGRPWITPEGVDAQKIINQVGKCPSGALSIKGQEKSEESKDSVISAEAIPNGPLKVTGDLSIKLPNGEFVSKSKAAFFCRCGGSANKPFCDGTHKTNGFVG